jgi:hypothetical protein
MIIHRRQPAARELDISGGPESDKQFDVNVYKGAVLRSVIDEIVLAVADQTKTILRLELPTRPQYILISSGKNRGC